MKRPVADSSKSIHDIQAESGVRYWTILDILERPPTALGRESRSLNWKPRCPCLRNRPHLYHPALHMNDSGPLSRLVSHNLCLRLSTAHVLYHLEPQTICELFDSVKGGAFSDPTNGASEGHVLRFCPLAVFPPITDR